MKRKANDPPKQVIVQIPLSLIAEVDLLLWDPVRERIKYGGRSKLIVKLLRSWIDEKKGKTFGKLTRSNGDDADGALERAS